MKKSLLLMALLSLTLVGCNSNPENKNLSLNNEPTLNQTSNAASPSEAKQVVASFYPLAFMAQAIVGETLAVTNLAGSGDVHDYEPSPQDLVTLNNADLVLVQGAQLEPWAEDVLEELESKGVMTLEVTHDLDLAASKEAHDEDHDEEDHEDEEEHTDDDHDEHDHGAFDPHTWLDPVLAQDMVTEILAALIAIDPANEDTYEANAQLLINKFDQLDQAFTARLTSCSNEEVIVSHDAFGYLARRYDFEVHAIAGVSTRDEPSAKILAELTEEAEEGVTHILTEVSNVTRFADTLASETGLTVLNVNPLGRGPLDPEKDFFDVMNENLESFSIALNCQA